MKLLIFDVDGTLTATNRVDGEAFSSAVRAVLPISADLNWSQFTEFTAAAILRELWATHSTEEYSAVEADVQRHLFAHLETRVASDPEAFVPIGGAQDIFAKVRHAGWTPAIATGGWRRSAEFKLATAGIATRGVPFATSSEHDRRTDIIRSAVRLAAAGAEPQRIVYVGDGAWDVRASRELGIGFVGRAGPYRAQRLLDLGASVVVPDFTDADALIALLSGSRSLVPSADAGSAPLPPGSR